MTVLVTNAKSRMAYNVARSLGQKGIDVIASDFVSTSMSFASRYVKNRFIYPSPFRQGDSFIDCLIERIQRHDIKVLIPIFEETFLISKNKDRFDGLVGFVLPDYEQILLTHNKDQWEKTARENGLNVPNNYSISLLRSGAISLNTISYPALIKPKQGGGGWAIIQVNSPQQLEKLLDNPKYNGLSWDRFFIQEKISGETQCVAMLFRQGELRAKVCYKQLRDFPVNGGQATLRISLRNENLENDFEKLLRNLKWNGVCQGDFVIDEKTQTPYLIDINPRFWGSLAQAIASGVDFPFLLYQIALEGDVEAVEGFEVGVMSRWIGGDLRALASQWFGGGKGNLTLLKDYLFVSKGVKKVYLDDFSLTDPLPFALWVYDIIYRMIKHGSLKPGTHESLTGIWK
ncbi:ATP-grasp domain-containing protein [Thermodesulfobacteriota bacterium]